MKQIFLEQVKIAGSNYRYVVQRLINTTKPKVGSNLSEHYVKDLCEAPADWKVNIK